jgi:protoheme IX farnesyltransferase
MATATPVPSVEQPLVVSPGERWSLRLRLTKPRIVALLLFTTATTMAVAAGGWPGTSLLLATLVGGAGTAGGANALNCWVERDRDARMARTARRPLPNGDLSPTDAAVTGTVLIIGGVAVLAVGANALAAALAAGGAAYYVIVYTIWLKPRSTQAVVLGGVAGAAPVLTAWAAVTDTLVDPVPWLLFGILFVWQPPHFWALAIRYRDDYAAAGLPMLPSVRGIPTAAAQSLAYTWAFALLTLGYAPLAGAELLYLAVAVPVVVVWLVPAHDLHRRGQVDAADRLFRTSLVALPAIQLAAAVSAAVG